MHVVTCWSKVADWTINERRRKWERAERVKSLSKITFTAGGETKFWILLNRWIWLKKLILKYQPTRGPFTQHAALSPSQFLKTWVLYSYEFHDVECGMKQMFIVQRCSTCAFYEIGYKSSSVPFTLYFVESDIVSEKWWLITFLTSEVLSKWLSKIKEKRILSISSLNLKILLILKYHFQPVISNLSFRYLLSPWFSEEKAFKTLHPK